MCRCYHLPTVFLQTEELQCSPLTITDVDVSSENCSTEVLIIQQLSFVVL